MITKGFLNGTRIPRHNYTCKTCGKDIVANQDKVVLDIDETRPFKPEEVLAAWHFDCYKEVTKVV